MKIKGSCLCGALGWTFDAPVDSATACNCTACRRYGTLWAYDHEGEGIKLTGSSQAYFRKNGSALGFHFCSICGCVSHWRGTKLNEQGQRRMAVNLRLAENPDQIAQIPIEHFDGLVTFDDLGQDGRCIKDMWF